MQKWSLIKNKSGSALVMAVMFSAVFIIIGTGTMKLISRGNQLHTRDVQVIRSYWANESALRVALRYLTRETPHPDKDITDFNKSEFIKINKYTPDVLIDHSSPFPGMHEYNITVNSKVGKINNTTSASKVTYGAFARYTYFQEGDGPGSYWVGMVVRGNCHSNNTTHIGQGMTNEIHVTGEATCASTYDESGLYPFPYSKGIKVVDPSSWNGTEFTKLVEKDLGWFKDRIPEYYSVDPIDTKPLAPKEGAFDQGWIIEDNTSNPSSYTGYFVKPYISGSGTGNVAVYGLKYYSGGKFYSYHLGNESIDDILNKNNGVIKSSKPIHIAGTVKGQLTIVSDQDIFLAGHLLYNGVSQGSMPTLTSQDICGIVSGDDIKIQSNYYRYYSKESGMWKYLDIPDVDWDSYYDEIDIYASLISKDGCIKPGYSYSTVNDWGDNGQNRMNLYGSSLVDAQDGTFSPYSDWGFVMDMSGDPRFMQNVAAPPGLPDLRADDTEMIVHYEVALAMKYPITVETWNNKIYK